MRHAYIPYGAYWSTPFVKWQGAFSTFHSLRFAAWVARRELAARNIDPLLIEEIALGTTVPQKGGFYGAPWFASLAGMPGVTGATVAQACATSARALELLVAQVERARAGITLLIAADRTSNGPRLHYPDPDGADEVEDWILDNFAGDPSTGLAMIRTAENVAQEMAISTEEQHDLVLMRYAQYQAALANDAAFQRTFMTLPFELPDHEFAATNGSISGDMGVVASTREGLAKLRPVLEGGTVTFGGQTHPADGNAGLVVASREMARTLATKPEIEIRVRGFGQARTRPAFMPAATTSAAIDALQRADCVIGQCDVIKSHNPFAINDIHFCRTLGVAPGAMNNFGCSLVYGHPQGPTGLRAVIEMIEELVGRGGGRGLFHGCAAGDTGMAVLIEVDDNGAA